MKELIHFSATWCQPCKQMQPVLDSFVSNNEDITYTKYDADESVSVFEEYKIRSVPAFISKIDGVVIKMHMGTATEEKLDSLFS